MDALGTDHSHQLNLRLIRFHARPQSEEPSMLALDLVNAGRPGDALGVVESALAREPDDADLLHTCGRALYERSELGWAQRFLVRAARVAPGWPEPLAALARVLLRRGQEEKAIRMSRQALRLGADDADLMELVRGADREAALDGWLARFREDPEGEEPSLLAAELLDHQRLVDALEVVDRGLFEDEHDPDLLFIRARAYVAQGASREARRDLETLVAIAPDHADGECLLAQVCLDDGALRSARAACARAAALEPERADVEALRERIEATIREREAQDTALDGLMTGLPPVARSAPPPARRSGWLPTIKRTFSFLPWVGGDGGGDDKHLSS